MYKIEEFIVVLWFLPATIFIIIPLILMIAWIVRDLFVSDKSNAEASIKS